MRHTWAELSLKERQRRAALTANGEVVQEKFCPRCKRTRKIKHFYLRQHRYRYRPRAYCKDCWDSYNKTFVDEYKNKSPWLIHYHCAMFRCSPKGAYYKKGRKVLMSVDDFKKLWFRDKAWKLSRPTVDRIDNNGNYTYDNCRFIELSENSRKGAK